MRSTLSITTLAITLAGCGGGLQPGQVQMALTGADQYQLFSSGQNHDPNHGVVSAVVTVNEIDARVNGNWIPLVNNPQQIDLLQLDNTKMSTLGIANLPSAKVNKLRMKLDEVGAYVTLKDGTKKPLEVPDNGIVTIDGKIDLDSCAAGTLIVDFDPKIKIEDEGSRTEYELTCRATVKTEEIKNVCAPGGGGGGGGGGGATCTLNSDCASGQACESGQCVTNLCQPGQFCPSGQTCKASTGMCVPIACTSPCPMGQTCGGDGMCH